MAERVRVGILGAGWAGTAHATAFSRLPDVEVAALWSRTRVQGQRANRSTRLENGFIR